MENDITLVKRFQAGEREAFGQLYDGYVKKIYDFIYYKTHHRETTEDLVSLTFTKALQALNNFGEREDNYFGAWLYRIARNTVTDHYRSKARQMEIQADDAWDFPADTDIAQDTETKIKIDQVRNYVQKLKNEQRELIIMRAWQGLSYKEIAELTGKSEASLKMMFSRTIKELKKEMPLSLLVVLLAKLL